MALYWSHDNPFVAGTIVRASSANDKFDGIAASFAALESELALKRIRLPDTFTGNAQIPNKVVENTLLYINSDGDLDLYSKTAFDADVAATAANRQAVDTQKALFDSDYAAYQFDRGVYDTDRSVYDSDRGVYDADRLVYDNDRAVYDSDRAVFDAAYTQMQLDMSAFDTSRIAALGQISTSVSDAKDSIDDKVTAAYGQVDGKVTTAYSQIDAKVAAEQQAIDDAVAACAAAQAAAAQSASDSADSATESADSAAASASSASLADADRIAAQTARSGSETAQSLSVSARVASEAARDQSGVYAGNASASEAAAQAAQQAAEEAAAAATGAAVRLGPWDASGGTLPPTPSENVVYTISAEGTLPVVGFMAEGDELRYDIGLGQWYAIQPSTNFLRLDGGTMSENIVFAHSKGIRLKNLAGNPQDALKINANDNVILGSGNHRTIIYGDGSLVPRWWNGSAAYDLIHSGGGQVISDPNRAAVGSSPNNGHATLSVESGTATIGFGQDTEGRAAIYAHGTGTAYKLNLCPTAGTVYVGGNEVLHAGASQSKAGRLTIEYNGTDSLSINRTAAGQYAGLSIKDENDIARWLLYGLNDENMHLSLQGRQADGVYQWTAWVVDNVTGEMDFKKQPSYNGFDLLHAGGGQKIDGDLTLDSGGVLHLDANRYDGNIAMHLHNSDVAGVNSLIWQDTSQNRGEGIVFPLSGVTLDKADESTFASIRVDEAAKAQLWDGANEYELIHTGGGQIIAGTLQVDSAIYAKDHVRVVDNKKFLAGTGDDMQMYHTGGHAYLDSNTGHLTLRAKDSGASHHVLIQAVDTGGISRTCLQAQAGAAPYARLFYDAGERLRTTNPGVSVYGELSADSAYFSGGIEIDGPGTIAGTNWSAGWLRIGSATTGWAMDSNELYGCGQVTIGTMSGDLLLRPSGTLDINCDFYHSGGTFTTQGLLTANGRLDVAGSGEAISIWGTGSSNYLAFYRSGSGNGRTAYIGHGATTTDHLYVNADKAGANIYLYPGSGGKVVTDGKLDVTGGIVADSIQVDSGQLQIVNTSTQNVWGLAGEQAGANLQIYQSNAGHDAAISFHVGGDYATHFGLNGATNTFCVGGWSAGTTLREMVVFDQGGSYAALRKSDGSDPGWIRTGANGLISNTAGSGSLGTTSWRWNVMYCNNGYFTNDWEITSDARVKENLRELAPLEAAEALERLGAAQRYDRIDTGNKDELGTIAQWCLEAGIDDVVNYDEEIDQYSVKYRGLQMYQLSARLDDVRRIAELEQEREEMAQYLSRLEHRLSALEAIV